MAWLSRALFFLVTAAAAPRLAGQGGSAKPAVPVDPIAAVVDAFKSHSIVALSEGEHGNEPGYALRLSLIRDSRFAALVNDIVVECGNSRYQGLVDRFVRGEDVPDVEVRQIWWEGIEPGPNCDRPMYEDFVRRVRAANASRPASQQLRVLIGEPPVDWNLVHRPEDLMPLLETRDARFAVDLIQREVLARRRRALLVFGSGHLQRRNIGRNYEPENTIVSLLENGPAPTPVFSIWAPELGVDVPKLQADIASWRVPSLTMLRGTVLGAADFTVFFPYPVPRASVRDGKRTPIPREQWRTLRMDEQFDAMLYLGPLSSLTAARLPRSLCQDSGYIKMRVERMALFGMQDRIEALRRDCTEP